jgi:hypothetical protein
MKAVQISTLVMLGMVCGTVYAQPPHAVTYSQVSVAPGTQVTINGEQYVAVQVPVRQFTVDSRYAVRFLEPVQPDGSVFAFLSTQHSTDPLPSTNATIDGFPALIQVNDGRTYAIVTTTDPITFENTNVLRVSGTATVTVQVKLGDTLLSGFESLSKIDHEADLGPNEYRGTAQAAYGKYTDPLSLLGVNGLDKWVDYIRIIPLN